MAITCLRAIIRLKGRPGSVSIDTFTVAVTDTGGVAVRSNVDIRYAPACRKGAVSVAFVRPSRT